VGKKPVVGCIACGSCKQPGKGGKVPLPEELPVAMTNFIR
jgi:hypothetical protein